jgi:hypothetical protein
MNKLRTEEDGPYLCNLVILLFCILLIYAQRIYPIPSCFIKDCIILRRRLLHHAQKVQQILLNIESLPIDRNPIHS